jgi:hypothetical protein
MQPNNKLINGYQQQQPKVQNNLLQRNQLFMNNMGTNSSQVMHAQQLQQMHQIKVNQNQNTVDKDKIKEILIKPIKLEKGNKLMFEKSFKEREADYKPKLEEYWKKKTNTPYKGILKNQNYDVKVKDEKDLVVHRITQKDKDVKQVEAKYNEFNDKIKTHDGELKVIYATSKKGEHKKKFDYTHTYQYRKPDVHNSDEDSKEQDHIKIKQDRYNYYKEQQKLQEKNKDKFDAVLEKLVSDKIFSADELGGFDTKKDEKVVDKKQAYLDRKK